MMKPSHPALLLGSLGLCALVGCGDASGEAPAPRAPVPVPSADPAAPGPALPPTGSLDPRDQYALYLEMEAVSAIDPESQGSAAAAVIGSWEGKKYRWSMMRVSALCANADNCLFAPFDMSRFDHPIDASFLPRVRFAPGEFESMQQQCAPHADQCVVTFEAVLEEVSVGPGAPPNLALSGGHVVSVHPRAEEEAFLSGATPAARANPNVRRAFLGRK